MRDAFDLDNPFTNVPLAPVQTPPVKVPPAEVFDPRPDPVPASGMIFVRNTSTGWMASFRGVKGMSPAELPLPGAFCSDTLGEVIAKVTTRWPHNWVLIAPL